MAKGDEVAEFAIDLNTDGTVSSAEDAANALEKLRAKIQGGTKIIADMERAQRNLKRGGMESSTQFKELTTKITEHRAKLAETQAAYLKLGGNFDEVKKRGGKMRSEFSLLSEVAKRLPGPLGAAVTQLAKFSESKAAAKAIMMKVAMVAFAASVLLTVSALTKLGVVESNARRNEAMQLEGMTKIRRWYGGQTRLAADSHTFLQEQIDKVSASSALGRSQIHGYTEQLYKMGLRSGNLQAALEGVAIVASTQGEAQAQMFANWAAGAAMTGQSVRKLADDVKARLGGLAARQMLSLDVQMRKLKENVSFLFSGLKIEGFLAALNQVTALFSANTFSGKALKVIIDSLFNPFVSQIEKAGPLAKRFFQGLIISALLLTITVLKVRNSLRDMFGIKLLDDADKLKLALTTGIVLGTVLAAVFAALAIKMAIVTAPIWGIALALYAAGAAGYKLGQFFIGAWEAAKSIDWGEAGTMIWKGIVGGITSGVDWVIKAMKNLGISGWKAFKGALGIASPSRLMMKTSVELPRGAALGVEAGLPKFKESAVKMSKVVPLAMEDNAAKGSIPSPVEAPALAPAPKSQGARQGGGNSLTIQNLNLAPKTDDPKGFAREFVDQVTMLFQDVGGQLGAHEPEPST